MRKIYLDKLRLNASVGILEHELISTQPLIISITITLPSADVVPAYDDVGHVFDYRNLRNAALEEATRGHTNMLETLAGRIAMRLLQTPSIASATVRVDKPSIFPDCESVAVEVTCEK